ncbi:GIY-YIG nuclease family protein [Janthinobacterium sp. HLS12-2]|uniref:GIY-YIG nuclease family protein n=1 Tax=Janthinobacterium sp. HLS12-2 TaxID=1259324 RepID=UPI003F234DE7
MGKSIRIYLPNETVAGIRHAEIANWTGQALACPRSLFSELREWPEIQRPGVYILFGVNDETGAEIAYIGEAEVLADRLHSHLSGKEFWSELVSFSSKDENLTKAHVRYLEARLVSMANEANRYRLENNVAPTLPSLPRADRDAMEEFLGFAKTLLGVLGHRILDPFVVRKTSVDAQIATMIKNIPAPAEKVLEPSAVFYLRVSSLQARAVWTEEGMVVFEGSDAALNASAKIPVGLAALRQSLIAAGVLSVSNEKMAFKRDHMFKSPSQAAGVITGYSINGRDNWKLDDGTTLNAYFESGRDLL